MKDFFRKFPFLSSLILSGIFVIVTLAVSQFADAEWFAGTTVTASASPDVSEDVGGDPETGQDGAAQTDAADEKKKKLTWEDLIAASEEVPEQEAEEPAPEEKPEETEAEAETASGNDAGGQEEPGESEPPVGVTEFVFYEPADVHSKYYEDPGKRPLTTRYPYSTVEKDYFNDAVFIGDSRMIGLYDYAGFDGADFFCDNGFCVYKWEKKGEVTFQNEHRKVNLMEALSAKQYGKVYLMIGMNDCGYGNTGTFRQGLQNMIAAIVERQPEAVIYLMANMYITREKEDEIFNNIDINSKNVVIAECADGKRMFYLEYNDLYQDESGCLKSELTFDGVHLYGKNYAPWVAFLLSHAVVGEE